MAACNFLGDKDDSDAIKSIVEQSVDDEDIEGSDMYLTSKTNETACFIM